MADTLSALVAAGIVYDRHDFADPRLDGPTALTVTADGRVFGHLATWGTGHIGMGRHVTPPKSPSGYKYFHQGVVATRDGDLPVGKLTLGTGHAPVARGITADAAAAHYDNTGAVVAAVRAGEDRHGIWLAGRLVPGIDDAKVDELRRSGVSGDWRGVNGQHELVAALAVNVPGFPIPRTEELVAAGTMALVAAGIVVPPGADLPQSGDEFNAVLAAAVAERVDVVLAERDRIAEAQTRIAAAADLVQTITAAARRDELAALVAAATDGAPAPRRVLVIRPDPELFTDSPTEVTVEVTYQAADEEVPEGAVVLYEDLDNLPLTAAGRRVRTSKGADRYGVGVGDLVPDAQTIGRAVGNDVGRVAEGVAEALGAKKAPAEVEVADEVTDEVADEVEPITPEPVVDEGTDFVAEDGLDPAVDDFGEEAVGDTGAIETSVPPRTDGEPGTRMEEDQSPSLGADGGELVDYADGVATYSDGTQTDGTVWTRKQEEPLVSSLWARTVGQVVAR